MMESSSPATNSSEQGNALVRLRKTQRVPVILLLGAIAIATALSIGTYVSSISSARGSLPHPTGVHAPKISLVTGVVTQAPALSPTPTTPTENALPSVPFNQIVNPDSNNFACTQLNPNDIPGLGPGVTVQSHATSGIQECDFMKNNQLVGQIIVTGGENYQAFRQSENPVVVDLPSSTHINSHLVVKLKGGEKCSYAAYFNNEAIVSVFDECDKAISSLQLALREQP